MDDEEPRKWAFLAWKAIWTWLYWALYSWANYHKDSWVEWRNKIKEKGNWWENPFSLTFWYSLVEKIKIKYQISKLLKESSFSDFFVKEGKRPNLGIFNCPPLSSTILSKMYKIHYNEGYFIQGCLKIFFSSWREKAFLPLNEINHQQGFLREYFVLLL